MRCGCLLILLTCAVAADLCAADQGDEVVIIFNPRVPESRGVADFYADRRHVPTNQIFGFDLPAGEDMSRTEFAEGLQKPLAKTLEIRKLWHIADYHVPATTNQPSHIERRVVESKIRYAVLCYGVPLRILPDPTLKEEGTESMRPEMRRNEAAVDSELALLPVIEQKLPLAGPLKNPLFTSTNESWYHPSNGVLMVTRLDGPSAAIARGLVDKAVQAEQDGLWGRAYFDLRNTSDPGYKIGDSWIRGAAEISRRLGFETIVDENPGTFPAGFPMSQIALYVGWYDEHVSGPFTLPTVEFMPGAFAYHLHSLSAATLRSTTLQWVGPLLAKGATITMGCVNEPYLTGTPDVAVFVARLVFQGFNYGAAACSSQGVLSWQTTVVGDPLYRPFGRNPEQLYHELQQRHSKLVEWYHLRLVNLNLASGRTMGEMASYLEDLPVTKSSAVLTEKLGDLYSGQGKPSSAVYAYTEALKLDPTPQQLIRLRLVLGEKLAALGRTEEAQADYEQLLKAAPSYPDKTSIAAKVLALEPKQNK
jgi:uncharacterized protein (TIGR03790 family)